MMIWVLKSLTYLIIEVLNLQANGTLELNLRNGKNLVVVKAEIDLNSNEILQFFVMCNVVTDSAAKYFEGGALSISAYQ